MQDKKRSHFTIIFLSILFLLLLGFAYKKTMSNDEGLWFYIARLWVRDGLPPYLSVYDTLPPGMILLYSLTYKLLGLNLLLPRIICIAAMICTGFCIHRIGSKIYGQQTGIVAMTIFGMTAAWPCVNHGYTAEPDSIMIFFLVCSLYLLIKPYADNKHLRQNIFLSGVMGGIALLFVQSALLSIIGIILFYIYYTNQDNQQPNRRTMLLFFITGLMSVQITGALILCAGSLTVAEYLSCTYKSLLYPTRISLYGRIILLLETWRYTEFILIYPLLFLFCVFYKKMKTAKIPVNAIAVLLMFDFMAVNFAGLYTNYNYKQLLPSLSLTAGIATVFLISTIASKTTIIRWIKWAVAIIIFIGLPVKGITFLLVPDYIYPKDYASRKFGKWIAQNTNPEHFVYIFGAKAPVLHAYADRQSPVRYIGKSFNRKPFFLRELITDLQINRPTMLIITETENTPDWLKMVIKQSYLLSHNNELIEIYRQR